MDNIISFQDKKKVNVIKEEAEKTYLKDKLLQIVDEIKHLVEQDKMYGLVAVGVGENDKIYTIVSGDFDIMSVIGGLETLKHYLVMHIEADENT